LLLAGQGALALLLTAFWPWLRGKTAWVVMLQWLQASLAGLFVAAKMRLE
jgi:hypothetical protein